MPSSLQSPGVPPQSLAPAPLQLDIAAEEPSTPKRWERADKIAACAALVAVAGFVVAALAYNDTRRNNRSTVQISQHALDIAQQADARSRITDETAFHAMVMLIDERVNEIVDATEDGKWQLKGIARGTSKDLLIQPNEASLAFIDQLGGRIPPLELSVDQITTLAKGPSNIAATVTQCVRMRNQLVTDLQGYRGVTIRDRKVKGLDLHQKFAFPVLPDRIGHVYAACLEAAKQLTALVPDQFRGRFARGTVGELITAQGEAVEERRLEEKYRKPAATPVQSASTHRR
jgi:hypothetical protein